MKRVEIKSLALTKNSTITGHKIYEIPTLLPRKKLAPIENETQLLQEANHLCLVNLV